LSGAAPFPPSSGRHSPPPSRASCASGAVPAAAAAAWEPWHRRSQPGAVRDGQAAPHDSRRTVLQHQVGHGGVLQHQVGHCAELHCAELHCSELHRAELHCAELHCAALHCAELHCAELHCAALHCAELHCAELHCAELHCAEVHCAAGACCSTSTPALPQRWSRFSFRSRTFPAQARGHCWQSQGRPTRRPRAGTHADSALPGAGSAGVLGSSWGQPAAFGRELLGRKLARSWGRSGGKRVGSCPAYHCPILAPPPPPTHAAPRRPTGSASPAARQTSHKPPVQHVNPERAPLRRQQRRQRQLASSRGWAVTVPGCCWQPSAHRPPCRLPSPPLPP
jgi:hypothetical protein